MESLQKNAYQVERDERQDARQVCTPTLTRPLNPEDIELARKRAELNLYLEKAASLEKEFTALRASLTEFSTHFVRLTGMVTQPSVRAGGKGQTEKFSAIVKAIREELSSEAMSALLGADGLCNREIPCAVFTLITGATKAVGTDQPVDGSGGSTGAELIRVIRKIYSARERILFLQRGCMKLRFSMLHRLMTEMQEAQGVNVDLLGIIAGVGDRVISSMGMAR
jgi:hypothetical protein